MIEKTIEFKTKRLKYFRRCLIAWWLANRRSFSWRDTTSPYEVLIAELLLRRTNATAAHTIYLEFLKTYPSESAMGNGQDEEIERLVSKLGLNWRAKNLVELAHYFAAGGTIPGSIKALSQLPGVGPYVARAVLVNCFELNVVPVDTNVVRVICRYLGLPAHDNLRRNKNFQALADSFQGDTAPRDFNHALLDFSSMICKAKDPKCRICPVSSRCKSFGLFESDR